MLCIAEQKEYLMGFLTEIERRNVSCVDIAYLVLGWVVIQVTDIVEPALSVAR